MTFAKYTDGYLEGIQKITQRTTPCTCGCRGKDPWHATRLRRIVREVEVFQAPRRAKLTAGYTATICATAKYKHPAGLKPCGLRVINNENGDWVPYGWATLETH